MQKEAHITNVWELNCDVVAVEVEGPVGDKRGAMEAWFEQENTPICGALL